MKQCLLKLLSHCSDSFWSQYELVSQTIFDVFDTLLTLNTRVLKKFIELNFFGKVLLLFDLGTRISLAYWENVLYERIIECIC